MLVIDASAAAALVLPDEPPLSQDAEDSVRANELIAPALWWLETGNLLQRADRVRRISLGVRDTSLRQLAELDVMVDDRSVAETWHLVIAISDAYGLTAYDAAYLELAIARGSTLVTLDKALIQAAARHGVPTIGCR